MKKTILLAAMAACLFATNVFAQKIKGSDTCLPLTQTEAENFMNKDKAAKITVTGGGSGVGISALMEGTTDIAMASRKMKFDSVVLDHAVVGEGAIIAAGSVVLSKTIVEPGSIYAGVPAKFVKKVDPEQAKEINQKIAKNYHMYSSWYKE